MSTFDNFLNKAKEVADAAAQKTGEVLEVSKLKLQEVKLTNSINKAYCELGSLYFNSVKFGGNNEQINACIAEIEGLLQQQAELQRCEEQFTAKQKCYCSACGHENSVSSSFCTKCGSSLTDKVVDVEITEEL